MKHALTFFCILMFTLACNFSSTPPPSTTAQDAPAPDSVPETFAPLDVASATPMPEFGPISTYTLLYISGTMHIETKTDSWPRGVDAFLALLEETTNAGMRCPLARM